MKEKSQERILKAIDRVFGEAIEGKSREKQFAEISGLLHFIQTALSVASTPEELKKVLDIVEEPSGDELVVIESLIALAPKLLPGMIGERIYAKAVVLTKQAPGRKCAIPEERYGEICDEVLSLVRQKCSLGDAKRRIALRHGVSRKTIDRIWSKRDQYHEAQISSKQAREMLGPILREAFSPARWKELREAISLASEVSESERT